MGAFQVQDTVGELVARRPALSRVFEDCGIDFCCGGKKTLEEVCRTKGWDPEVLVGKLEEWVSTIDEDKFVDVSAMTLTELADHIEQTHHAYLQSELPRLDRMAQKVASVHGNSDSRLREIREVFSAFISELSSHMMKEEKILFPMIRELESAIAETSFHCGSIANPIGQMELEHHVAGDALTQLRELSDGYTPPDWACNTYRALLDGLKRLELDMHQHIHKEDHVLFPKAMQLESKLKVQALT